MPLTVYVSGGVPPHALTDKEFVARYGNGATTRSQEGIRRTYFDSRCKAWLSALIQSDVAPKYRIVQEVTISSLPLSAQAPSYRGKMCPMKLGGIALGDAEGKILKAVFGREEREKAKLAGRETTRIRLNPISNESDLYYLFYVRDSVVVGMSIGVTE